MSVPVPVPVTVETIDREIARATRPVLLDFWAPWCGYCRTLAPLIERMSAEHDLHLIKVNTDATPEIAQRFGVQGIPLLLLFRDGQFRGRSLGVATAAQLERALGLTAAATAPPLGQTRTT